jgi:hypothetical protein
VQTSGEQKPHQVFESDDDPHEVGHGLVTHPHEVGHADSRRNVLLTAFLFVAMHIRVIRVISVSMFVLIIALMVVVVLIVIWYHPHRPTISYSY